MSSNWPADMANYYLEQLAKARAEHERVREGALRAYEQNELREEHARLQHAAAEEVRRLQLEEENARLELKLRSLKAAKIELPPRPPTPPPPAAPPAPAPVAKEPPSQTSLPKPTEVKPVPASVPEPSQAPAPAPAPPTASPFAQTKAQTQATPTTASQTSVPSTTTLNPFKSPAPVPAPQQPAATTLPAPSAQTNTVPPPGLAKPAAQATTPYGQIPGNLILSKTQELAQIHQKLKELRAHVTSLSKQNAIPKKDVGEMRRQIRKSVGQLTEGKGANKVPTANIADILSKALNTVPSPPANPGIYVVDIPAPAPDAVNNGDTLPILFLYLLNVFAKAIVRQLGDEAGVKPEAADPVGMVAVSVFARKEFCWRGVSMIDILIAKLRVACPVLFGLRGSERTEEGRARLGWRKEGGHWVPDQVHSTRMTGFGAGYAAIALRNFSKSSMTNPYPPYNYWMSIASILNTPGVEISSTQCTVLKAMIEHHEQRFLQFFGSAGRAVLQVALVDFPARATEKSVAVTALKVLGDKLQREVGLSFAPVRAF